MTIAEKIKESILAVHPGVPIAYDDDNKLNVILGQYDKDEHPFVVYFTQIDRGNIIEASGQYRERVITAVFFIMPTPYDMTDFSVEQGIDICKKAALQWLAHLPFDDYVGGVVTATERLYDKFDDIFIGFGLRMDIQELVGWTDCATAPYDFNNDFNNDFLIAI